MKKNWLRGLLLGVSLALLLSGGVALANSIAITTDPVDCLKCTMDEAHINWLALYSSGWSGNEDITFDAWLPDGFHDTCSACGTAVAGVYNDPHFAVVACPGAIMGGEALSQGAHVQNAYQLGEYRLRLTGDTSGLYGEFTILVAEDCAAAMFVPEPGSILLLGSGLAGLAGYATLRWRSRE